MDVPAWRRFRRNPSAVAGAVLVALVLATALVGPLLAPADPDHQFEDGLTPNGLPLEPGDRFVLGTDHLGRDELSRLLHGGRASLGAAFAATSIAVAIGLLIGLCAGYFGGVFDSVAMQVIDVLQSLPFLLIAITVNRVVSRPSIGVLIVLLGMLSWTTLARVTRAKTMQVRELEYVQAARALGLSDARIVLRHVLPNVLGPAIVIGTTLVANTILVESAMSFLGLGVPPPTSTWGTMLHDAQDTMSVAPRLVFYPGLMIVATVFGFNLLGDGLRDAFDPKDSIRSSSKSESAFGFAGLGLLAAGVAAIAIFLPPPPQGPRWQGAGRAEDQPQRGGTFVFFHESDLRGFDPHISYDEISAMAIKLVFEGLIEHDHNLRFVPRLARELPEVDPNGLVYTFRLREGVRFHNGRELVAEDVRWSMEHLLHPDTGSAGAPFYMLIDGVEDFRAGRADHVRGIRVLDRYTVQFRLSRPDQTFLHAMSLTFAMPVAREAYERWGEDVARHPIGTGAFVLETWEPGMRVTFRRNENFYRPGEPYVDRMVFELNLQRGPAFMRFQQGEIDHIHRFAPADYLAFREQRAWRPYIAVHPLVDIWGLQMNCELPPFTNRHVRRAVAFAVDGERWNRARANRLLLHGQPVPRAIPGYDPGLRGHYYDLERARREMALAGHPVRCVPRDDGGEECVAEGLEDEIDLWIGEGPTGQAYGALAQQDLARIGLRIRLRPVSFPVYLQETGRPQTVPLLFGGWSMDFPDAASFLEPLFHSRSIHEHDSENRAYYRNPEVDALLDRARVERDPGQRVAIYREVSRILVEDAPWAFIFSNLKMEAWQPYVRGFRPHPVWEQMYRDVWLDLPRRRTAAALRRAGAQSFAALAPFGGWW
jgi:ABC-type dipeptide/oligopeptide/nickel transport system permease subunit/ABC-type transport system substrate-binding protein